MKRILALTRIILRDRQGRAVFANRIHDAFSPCTNWTTAEGENCASPQHQFVTRKVAFLAKQCFVFNRHKAEISFTRKRRTNQSRNESLKDLLSITTGRIRRLPMGREF
jgi:hypothetical protein